MLELCQNYKYQIYNNIITINISLSKYILQIMVCYSQRSGKPIGETAPAGNELIESIAQQW